MGSERRSYTSYGWSPGPSERTLGLWVSSAGHYVARDHCCATRIRDDWILIYCIAGHGTFSQGNATFQISAGEAFVGFPGLQHAYQSDPQDGWEIRWAHFQGELAARLVSLAGFSVDRPALPLGVDPSLVRRLRNLCNVLRRKKFHAGIDAAEILSSILLAVHRLAHGLQQDRRALQNALTPNAATLGDMAARAGMSKFHFARTFRETIGLTPWRYVMARRISRAKELLADTALPIKAVALEAGFEDPNYFSRLFRRETGMTASDFRQRNAQQA